MVRYQRGEAAAVERLVHAVSPLVWRYLSAYERNRADREDVLQECWIRIHRSRHSYRPDEPVLPWIFAIARHTRLDAYRRRHRWESREILVAEPPEAPRVDWLEVGAWPTPVGNLPKLTDLLEQIPESQREVILMLKLTGMSLEEVARATSSTIGSIKQKAHRAYKKLRELAGKEGRRGHKK